MSRVAVIGCGGSGKSTLARELAARLRLPVIHLDAHYWRPGWVRTPDEEWEPMQPGLFAGDAWVADGNYHSTLRYRTARADTVVFLDFPRRTCLRGVFGRLLRQHGQVRSDMAPECPEGFDLGFLRWVWSFHRTARPRMLEVLNEFERAGGRVVTLSSRRAVDSFLRGLA
jgi:adenylate kinase family enzyme